MTTDLFGDPVPPATDLEIVRRFVADVKRHGRDSFNAFRARHGIGRVPRHIGVLVRAACERAEFIPSGTCNAPLPASNGRLCRVWSAGK